VLRDTTFIDRATPVDARYRIVAVNGWGEHLVAGSAGISPTTWITPVPLVYGQLRIQFTVPGVNGSESVDAAITDAGGRVQRAFAHGSMPAGVHVFLWDGTDGLGRRVASGVYFLQLRIGNKAEAHRVIINH
jgi:flagellar hook assembly protein FlgD